MTDKQHSPHSQAQSRRPAGPGAMPRKITPGAAQHTPQPARNTRPETSPENFGRIDSDGHVWLLREGHEDRLVGQWQAGSPQAGLQHFAQKFEDLVTEVDTLGSRLRNNPEYASDIEHTARELLEQLDSLEAIGDFNALQQRLESLTTQSVRAEEDQAQRRATQRQQAKQVKTALVEEAEKLAENVENWKAAGARFREIVDTWRVTKGLDKHTDDELWARFSQARERFNKRRGAHFAEMDKRRDQSRRLKEDLIRRAEELQHSTRWAEASAAYHELMDEWKAAGPAPREVDDELWERFRAARQVFFDARQADHDARDQEYEANAEKKLALIDKYEDLINPEEHLDTAQRLLWELQDKWDAIGFVPRGKVQEFEDLIAGLEKKVSDAAEAQWRKTDPELQARVDQFKLRAEQLQQQSDTARAAGNKKKAETLQAQADQWIEWANTAAEHTES